LGQAQGAVQRRRKILLVPRALKARLAELNCDFSKNSLPYLQTRRGAPDGNSNALSHGRFTREAYRRRAAKRALYRKKTAQLRAAKRALQAGPAA
jgi:hypothetical protein